MGFHVSITALGGFLISVFATLLAAVIAAYVFGPLRKNRGQRKKFYGEDLRHALKGSTAFNGVRLVLKSPVNAGLVRERLLQMLAAEGGKSLLRVHVLSATEYCFSSASDAEVAAYLLS
jgi:hypothetical protein